MVLVEILASALLIILLPFILLVAAVLLGATFHFFRWKADAGDILANNPRFLLIVPAHNEQDCIETTLKSFDQLDYPAQFFRILVLADNCTDRTAAIARTWGAMVYERTNPELRGKGYALAELFDWIPKQPEVESFEWICVLDADSVTQSNYLKEICRALPRGLAWYQTDDAVRNFDDSWRTRLLAWAFALFNGTWQMGCDQIGIGASLRGNGMVLSKAGLRRIPWKASGLAEDMEMSWAIKIRGEQIGFIREARVLAEMPTIASTSESQRQRWEHGRRALRQNMPRQILAANLNLMPKIMHLVELRMPGLSSFAMLLIAGWLLSAAAALSGNSVNAESLGFVGLSYTLALTILVLYGITPFLFMGLSLRVLAGLGGMPVYFFWRLIILVKSVPSHWIRTTRERQKK